MWYMASWSSLFVFLGEISDLGEAPLFSTVLVPSVFGVRSDA
jgi:hypothetical protein